MALIKVVVDQGVFRRIPRNTELQWIRAGMERATKIMTLTVTIEMARLGVQFVNPFNLQLRRI